MTQLQVKVLNYEVQQVGKRIKASKIRHKWEFLLQNNPHQITLETSLVSGKIKVICNDKLIKQEEHGTSKFQIQFILDQHSLKIHQLETSFELLIDNKVFINLLNQEKSNQHFSSTQQSEDFVLEKKIINNQKIKLKLPNEPEQAMKKKKYHCQNWTSFVGGHDHSDYFTQENKQKQNVTNYKQTNNTQVQQTNPTTNHQQNFANFLETGESKVSQSYEQPEQVKIVSNTVPNQISTQTTVPNEMNTMQNLFKHSEQLQSKNMQDFSTMQQLFATINNCTLKQQINQLQPSQTKFDQKVNLDNFNTMQNLFATNAHKNVVKEQEQTFPRFQNNNIDDFNTMQGLFKTINISNNNSLNLEQLHELPQQKSEYNQKQEIQNNSVPPLSNTDTNISDFNTIQNLFKTICISDVNGENKQPDLL